LLVVSGNGGQWCCRGGAGGLLSDLKINTSHLDFGQRGDPSRRGWRQCQRLWGHWGKRGSITKISQSKDLNSAINLIEAGNGGASAAGKGGNGGNVSTVNTLGFIGKPSDGTNYLGAFDEFGLPQGVFSGRGGVGSAETAPQVQ
jgi:hypothetical protein